MLTHRSLVAVRDLVGMNTVSRESNLELIHFVRDALAHLGIRCRLTFNAERTKANLFATLGDAGKPAGIVLSGHTDTVPWDGQAWSVDPLSATVRDGRLFGRGSADMKGFIGVVLANAERLAQGVAEHSFHLALSYDEETGCFGVRELLADLRDAGIQPRACIVGEPTSMVPALAHKGVHRFRCCVRGKEAHSSLTPRAVNAIEVAARLVARLRAEAERWQREEPRDDGFDVPFSTASVGQFHGGIADNVVPRDAWFHYEFRDLPTADVESMQARMLAWAAEELPAMQAVDAGTAIDFEPICAVPSFLGSAQDAISQLALRLSAATATTLVAFGTEAGLFKRAGIPTVVCGPGSIEQAHQPDEYVSLAQLAQCEDFLIRLANASLPQATVAGALPSS